MWPYRDKRHDHVSIPATYNKEQVNVSPMGMRSYEALAEAYDYGDELANFVVHTTCPTGTGPDATGRRVRGYLSLLEKSVMMQKFISVFARRDEHFAMCPSHIHSQRLKRFCDKVIKSRDTKNLRNGAKKFRRNCVRDCTLCYSPVHIGH